MQMNELFVRRTCQNFMYTAQQEVKGHLQQLKVRRCRGNL